MMAAAEASVEGVVLATPDGAKDKAQQSPEVESVRSASSSSSDEEGKRTDASASPARTAKRRRLAGAESVQDATAHKEVAELVARAREAQKSLENATQEQVDLLIKAMTYAVSRDGVAEQIAKLCVEETRLGDYAGKLAKIKNKTKAALHDIAADKSVGEIERDPARALVLIAKPVGVIAVTTPSTNPEATPVIKAINCIKGRNALVIAPHPRAKRTNALIVSKMRGALECMGFPADLVIGIEEPSRAKTLELMKLGDRVWATGGNGMVRYAHTSGTPALGVGQGNAAVVVDACADPVAAANNIRRSKTFDLAASCSADNAVLADRCIYDRLLAALVAEGGFLVSPEQKAALQRTLWTSSGALNADAVVKPAVEICRMAGFEIPADRTFVIVPEEGVGAAFPFSGEKLSVVVALYKTNGIDHAIELTNAMHRFQGQGHSAGIHSATPEHVERFAMATKTSRIMVNQPQSLSNSGALWNGMRQTLSLGCGSWGGTSTSENVYWRHLVNVTYVSSPLAEPKVLPPDAELFAGVPLDRLAQL